MKACGIIVEYNPFHNGHKYHLEKARELTGAEVVIACMSGNFLQRGELLNSIKKHLPSSQIDILDIKKINQVSLEKYFQTT